MKYSTLPKCPFCPCSHGSQWDRSLKEDVDLHLKKPSVLGVCFGLKSLPSTHPSHLGILGVPSLCSQHLTPAARLSFGVAQLTSPSPGSLGRVAGSSGTGLVSVLSNTRRIQRFQTPQLPPPLLPCNLRLGWELNPKKCNPRP